MRAAESTKAAASTRNGWLLSAPALVILTFAAVGPLLIVVIYSFLTAGKYGNVEWQFSLNGWIGTLFSKDIFDETYTLADAHLSIFWRSVKLSVLTTMITFLIGFPTAWFIATRPPKARALWLFLITIPCWTNLLIRTYAINEVIRNEGLMNTVLIALGAISTPIRLVNSDTAVFIGMAYVYLPLMVLRCS